MATTGITLDSGEVLAIANRIESDNNQLRDLLNESKSTIDRLSSMWSGRAADETRASYDSFATKFFQQYQDVLNQYVTFLRRNVSEQYTDTENVNVQLADAFK
jgi:WXG100 family type VII secretion target